MEQDVVAIGQPRDLDVVPLGDFISLSAPVGLMKEGRLWVVFLHTRYFLWFIVWTTSSSPLPLLPPWEGGNFVSLAYVRSCTPMLAPPYTPSKHQLCARSGPWSSQSSVEIGK